MTGLYDFFTKRDKKQSHVSKIEIIDIRKSADEYSPILPFVFMHRIMLQLRFASTSVDLFGFADGAALGNGIKFIYNEESLMMKGNEDFAITQNSDLELIAFDSKILADSVGATNRTFGMRLTWEKISPRGFDMRSPNKFVIKTLDDLSAVGLGIDVAIQGWVWGKNPAIK